MDQPKRPSKIRLIVWISIAVLFVGGLVSMVVYKSNRDSGISAIEKLVPGSKARKEQMTRSLEFDEDGHQQPVKLMKSVDLVFDESEKALEEKLMSQLSKSGWTLVPLNTKWAPTRSVIGRNDNASKSPDQFNPLISISLGNVDEDGEIERDPKGKSTIVTVFGSKTETFMDFVLPMFFLEQDAKLLRGPSESFTMGLLNGRLKKRK